MSILISSEKSTKTGLLKNLLYVLYVFFPYMFQPVRLEDGSVLKKLDYTRVDPAITTPGYYVMVEVCRYPDVQTLYSSDYTPKRSLVRVSKKFYSGLYPGASLKVFCQFHRVYGDKAKLWLAR